MNKITYKQIFNLAVPAVLSGIAEPLISITDTAIVGNMDKNPVEGLAAVGIVGSFLSMLIWVMGQTRSAISALVSRYLGANKIEEIKVLPAQAIYLNLLLALVVIGVTFPFQNLIFGLFEAKGLVLDYCQSYFSIRVWGFPFTLFAFAVFGIFRGLQNTFYPMVVALIGAVTNVGLDFALVYGIPKVISPFYLEGAAYASLISQFLMAVLAYVFLKRKTSISLRFTLPFHPELKNLIGMSLNLFVRTLALNVALLLAVREATALGNAQIGAHAIAINLWLFSAFFIDGFSAAGNSIGGKLLGEKNYAGLYDMGKKIGRLGLAVSLFLLVFSLISYDFIGKLFSKETVVLNAFSTIFGLVIISLPINAVAFVFDGIYKGLGEMKFLRNVLLLATLLGFIPTLYFLKYFGWGLQGIWISFLVWMLIRGGALALHFIKTYRHYSQKA